MIQIVDLIWPRMADLGMRTIPLAWTLLTTEIAKIRRECKRVVSLSNQEAH
jgi:hypothetical protein